MSLYIDLEALRKKDSSVNEVMELYFKSGCIVASRVTEHPLDGLLFKMDLDFEIKQENRIKNIILREIEFLQKRGDYRFPKEYLNWSVAREMADDYAREVKRHPIPISAMERLVKSKAGYFKIKK
jgi:hypothetical protein